MARLPEADDLGELPSFESGRPISSVDLSGIAAGGQGLARGLGIAADAFAEMAERERQEQDQQEEFNLAKAKTNYLVGRVGADGEFEKDNRPDGLVDEYKKTLTGIGDKAQQTITDPRRKEQFALWRQVQDAESFARIESKQWNNKAEASVADGLANLQALHDTALKSKDPREKAEVITIAGQIIATMEGPGYITKAKAQEIREKWARGYATASLMSLSPKERMAALDQPAGQGSIYNFIPDSDKAQIRRVTQQELVAQTRETESQTQQVHLAFESAIRRMTQGVVIPTKEGLALETAAQASGDQRLAQDRLFFERFADWQAERRQARPEEIAADIAAQEARQAHNGATALDMAALDAKKQFYKTIDEGIKNDMLGHAERMGFMPVPNLDFNDPGSEEFVRSLNAREARARIIATHYGREQKFFKAHEREALSHHFSQNPDGLVGFAFSLKQAVGDRAPDVLKELSKDAPVLSHVVGVASANNNDRLVREMAAAQKLKASEGYKPIQYPETQRQAIAATIGPALSQMPETYASALKVADMLFELRAQSAGIDPVAKPALAGWLYERALQDAMGFEGGKGGLGKVNGIMTVIPPGLKASDLEAALHALQDNDLSTLPPMGKLPGGVPVRAQDLRNGYLVAAGNGRYAIALRDPRSDHPEFVARPNGDYWEIDAATLMKMTSWRDLGISPSGPQPGYLRDLIAPELRQ